MAGLAGYKAGYIGKVLQISKKNQMYVANLKAGLSGIPRRAQAALSAAVLDYAIENTHHDSSRFAANWDLAIGGSGMRTHYAPEEYGRTIPGTDETIGFRGDSGSVKARVRRAKALYYGYIPSTEPGKIQLVPNGRLWELYRLSHVATTTSPPPTPPRSELFNPYTRIHTYVGNALPLKEGSTIPPGVAQYIGNAAIASEILRLTRKARFPITG